MDLPQHGLVRLAFDPPHECWIIQHDMTGERVRLPGGKSRVWQLGHDDAGAVFVVCSEESIWCDELFSLRLVVDNDGSTFVVDEASESGQSFLQFLSERSEHEIVLDTGRKELRLKVWVFAQRWDGCAVWWSFASLRRSAQIESAMTTSKWIQSWWPWWMKFIARFLVASSPHLRRVAPGAKGQPCASYHGLDERLLEEHSVSSLGLLALLSRWACRGRSKKSSASAENASEWARMLQRIVEHLVVPFLGSQLWFYMDSSVICVPALPIFGEHPIACAIRDGNIFLANLGSTALGTNLIKALGSECMRLSECLVKVLEIGAQFDFFFKQLLHQCGHALEASIADRLRPHGENVAGDGLRQAPDPMDLVRKPLPDVLLGATGGGTYVRNQQSFRLPPTCCHARQSSDYRH